MLPSTSDTTVACYSDIANRCEQMYFFTFWLETVSPAVLLTKR
jgi:hypothetical protein